ncbi:MAG: hypothetical protein DWQ44_03360 [Bacteroidetes bacterium]|nr:MAG: hypothetical protein DWQ39_13715 [Bacteroidota bacterium]REK35855.1 MAG: hypothetical protein DWQ44_03360 [Bacteroidota bacterium]REK50668.1 MAG: hypothetical protein DWQ48_05005 [Bacteroidota bacterium]
MKTGWHILILCSAFIFSSALQAQKVNPAELELQKKADKFYVSGDYQSAIPLYSQLLSLHPNNALYNFRYGSAVVIDSKEKTQAIPFLEKASRDVTLPGDVYFYLGQAYMHAERYAKASESFEKFNSLVTPSKKQKMESDLWLGYSRNAENLSGSRKNTAVLNSREISRDNFQYSFDLSTASGRIIPLAEIFQSQADRDKKESLYMFISRDGQTGLFASYGKNGITGKDLYRVRKTPSGNWSEPENLGAVLNTAQHEDHPYLDIDGKTLYFCSKGHNSMGGYDIFKTVYNYNTGEWSVPENLGVPLNSVADDIFFIPDVKSGRAQYATSFNAPKDKYILKTVSIENSLASFAIISGQYMSVDQPTRRDARIIVLRPSDNAIMTSVWTDSRTGKYEIVLPAGEDYVIVVEAGGYLPLAERFYLPPDPFDGMRQEIRLKKNGKREEIMLSNFFSRDVVSGNALASGSTETSVSPEESDSSSLIQIRIDDKLVYVHAPEKVLESTQDGKQDQYKSSQQNRELQNNNSEDSTTGDFAVRTESSAIKEKSTQGITLPEKDKYDPSLEQELTEDEIRQIKEESERMKIIEEEENNPAAMYDFNISNEDLAEIALEDSRTLKEEADKLLNDAAKLRLNASMQDSIADALEEEAAIQPTGAQQKKKELLAKSAEYRESGSNMLSEAAGLETMANIKLDESNAAKKDAENIMKAGRKSGSREALATRTSTQNSSGSIKPGSELQKTNSTSVGDIKKAEIENEKAQQNASSPKFSEQENEKQTRTTPVNSESTQDLKIGSEQNISANNEEPEQSSAELTKAQTSSIQVGKKANERPDSNNANVSKEQPTTKKEHQTRTPENLSAESGNQHASPESILNEQAALNSIDNVTVIKEPNSTESEKESEDASIARLIQDAEPDNRNQTSSKNTSTAPESAAGNKSTSDVSSIRETPTAGQIKASSSITRKEFVADSLYQTSLLSAKQSQVMTAEAEMLYQMAEDMPEGKQQDSIVNLAVKKGEESKRLWNAAESQLSDAIESNPELKYDKQIFGERSQTLAINKSEPEEKSSKASKSSPAGVLAETSAIISSPKTEDNVDKTSEAISSDMTSVSTKGGQRHSSETDKASDKVTRENSTKIKSGSSDLNRVDSMIAVSPSGIATELLTRQDTAGTQDVESLKQNSALLATEVHTANRDEESSSVTKKTVIEQSQIATSNNLGSGSEKSDDSNAKRETLIKSGAEKMSSEMSDVSGAGSAESKAAESEKLQKKKAERIENSDLTVDHTKKSNNSISESPDEKLDLSKVRMEEDTDSDLNQSHPAYSEYTDLKEKIRTGQVETINLFAEAMNLSRDANREKEEHQKLMDRISNTQNAEEKTSLLNSAIELKISYEKKEHQAALKFRESQENTGEIRVLESRKDSLREIIAAPGLASDVRSSQTESDLQKSTENLIVNESTNRVDRREEPATKNETTQSAINSELNPEPVKQDNIPSTTQTKEKEDEVRNTPLVPAGNIARNEKIIELMPLAPVNPAPIVNISRVEAEELGAQMFSKPSGITYSSANPIPLDPALPEGLSFKVQIGAFRKPIPDNSFRNLQPISAERSRPGWIRYCVGMFRTFEPANLVKTELRRSGYPDAFVVAYYNGERISLQRARELMQLNDASKLTAYNSEMSKEIAVLQRLEVIRKDIAVPSEDRDAALFYGSSANISLPALSEASSSVDRSEIHLSAEKFTVQIGVYRTATPPSLLASFETLYGEVLSGGLHRFMTGLFDERAQAETALVNARNKGIPDAFITRVRDARLISYNKTSAETSNVSAPASVSNVNVTAKESASEKKPEGVEALSAPTIDSPVSGKIIYRVQIGAFRENVSFSAVESFLKIRDHGIIRETDARNLNIFYAGEFSEHASAEILKAEAVRAGISDAFVVAFSNGKKIPVQDALRISGQ